MTNCHGWLHKITRPIRAARAPEPPGSARERRQALIAALLNDVEVDDPPGHLPGLCGGFRFRIRLHEAGNPARTLTVTFAKAGYRTYTVTSTHDGGHERRWGLRTLRGDLPAHHAAAELVLALFGTGLQTRTTPGPTTPS